jgi:hypothetical protein
MVCNVNIIYFDVNCCAKSTGHFETCDRRDTYPLSVWGKPDIPRATAKPVQRPRGTIHALYCEHSVSPVVQT